MTSRRPGRTRRVRVVELDGSGTRRREDRLATEEPLEIRVEPPGRAPERFGITMRTPGHDFELAAGLLFAEGVYDTRDDIRSVAYCTDADLSDEEEFNVVTVHLTTEPRASWQARTLSSACGVCGKQSASDVAAAARTGRDELRLDPATILALPERLREGQQVFDSTGALHAAGLFDASGRPLVVREDVGRHNAVDKALGHCLLDGVDLSRAVLCVSGRVAFEIVQKATAAGVPAIVAVGAPSSLAVETAERTGSTIVGFVRDARMVVYTHHHRVATPP